ncbi:alpha/beta fold hydrolase [Promicromonospora thailandica]|uniref:Lysophospholipase, alpha-beta hydrolase superfamily n=1 Tax=Promicromonospora thailandica TaxID=765201 RepID=A0A9X2G284_9MICO|nr:alpha/beta fold hydrolase [Promicromonospora thailandica]MCP2265717.1 Lysophospholipase, alpha-beta hydrolase superfamily [Promicromonospora thailandica]BFF21731.1 alpha/beta fold hydrolase [Promicromonospora thailandica]
MPRIHPAVRAAFRTTGRLAPSLAVTAAYRLFRTIGPRTPVREADRATHERARRGELRVAGERVATYAWGDPAGSPVLLVHGWQSRASRFARLVDDLEQAGHHVLAFDGVAHGDSTGRRTTILDHLAIARRIADDAGPFAGVVGHSFGGLAAGIALAEGLPGAVLATVAAVPSFSALNAGFLRTIDMPPALDARHAALVAARLFPADRDPVDRFDLLRHPAPAPALFVHGTRDREVPAAAARALHAAHPRSRLLEVDAGHNSALDEAAARAAVVGHVAAGGGEHRVNVARHHQRDTQNLP